jgi:signal transduction histidine kinase
MLSAVVTVGLLVASFERDRRLPNLLLLCAVLGLALSDFVYSAAPAMTRARSLESIDGARFGWELIVAVAFAGAALSPDHVTAEPRRRLVKFAVGLSACAVVLGVLLAKTLAVTGHAIDVDAGIAGAATNPVAVAIHTTSASVLALAAFAFLSGDRREEARSPLFAGAALLLAAANLQYLAAATIASDWITPREALRLAAYGLLLGGAYAGWAKLRRDEAYAAICSERERIAADLHDGLAQDLACIAAQGQRLDCQLGPEHPLMLAARHALAASRGVIAELTACTAPTTERALRLVADELGRRFDMEVNVLIETDTVLSPDTELEPAQRETVIRIAREAIVNAALHGSARHVDVMLMQRRGTLLMRVSDDGRGIDDVQRPGFGLQSMHARASSLGGQLNTRKRASGDTDLELLLL